MRFCRLFLLLLLMFCFSIPAFSFELIKGKSLQDYYDNPELLKKEEHKQLKKEKRKANRDAKIDAFRKRPSWFGKKNIYNTPNYAPVSMENYINISKDKKRYEIVIPQPKYPKDSAIVSLPDPHYRITKYNIPAGAKNLNITEITTKQKINSVGVLSPDMSKVVYSSAYYYPSLVKVASDMHYIKCNPANGISENLTYANELNKEMEPVLQTGLSDVQEESLRTLTLIDWSADSKKIAVKERVGSSFDGVWKTNLIVYDFDKQRSNTLNEVREAIRYWWKNNENLDLVDYMWDIYPIGWDANNPDRILVYAYAFTETSPKFLGTWSVDYNGERSQLMSIKSTDFEITTNGYMLNSIIRE